MSHPAAELRQISKSFASGRSSVVALDRVSLTLHPGELTLIEGPSGSGKTTLLHILGLLQRPDSGEVLIAGRRVDTIEESRLPDLRRAHVAFIFQGYNLLDALTLKDNVSVAHMLDDRRHPEKEIDEHIRRLGLADRSGHVPPRLSGGEKQRTTIARALACPGQLVLADEPTANLDWENAQGVVAQLADLAHEEGRAVVMVSHDSRLEPFADRIIRLLNGQIVGDLRIREPDMASTKRSQETRPSRAVTKHPGRALVTVLCFVVLALLAVIIALLYRNPTGTRADSDAESRSDPTAQPVTPYVAAAPALVEPSTHLVALRSERRGRIARVLKRAGEPVTQGEPLVILDDSIARALVHQRQAELELAESNLSDLKAWDREEEVARAQAGVDAAQARLSRAERELERVRQLHESTAAPTTELNFANEERDLAAAILKETQQTLKISQAGPTAEGIAVAAARVQQADAALKLAEAELALLTITSPLDGHVIYRYLEPGEVVDPESPVPILSVGNLDRIRLRAEVDEADIQRVQVGQPVVASAEAYPERTFSGWVVHLEPLMGRKSIRTERTTEQLDTKVREVLIELDEETPALPIDLQMTVRFLSASTASLPAPPIPGGE